jgi:muconolactone delta-isomerase
MQPAKDWRLKHLEKTDGKCVHEWKYAGHGHNYSVYKCNKCKKTEEY